eukprot:16327568-Heterocapsa_arctica.AAC.1
MVVRPPYGEVDVGRDVAREEVVHPRELLPGALLPGLGVPAESPAVLEVVAPDLLFREGRTLFLAPL